MTIQRSLQNILAQIEALITCLDADQYSRSLEVLSGSSIGMHIRHIVEFLDLLLGLSDHNKPLLNYDARKRDFIIEVSARHALQKVRELQKMLDTLRSDFPLRLSVTLDEQGLTAIVASTFERELAYNLEHAIHHLAIIKTAVIASFPAVNLPPKLGIAYSTIQYNKNKP